jgi:hypothetical protein
MQSFYSNLCAASESISFLLNCWFLNEDSWTPERRKQGINNSETDEKTGRLSQGSGTTPSVDAQSEESNMEAVFRDLSRSGKARSNVLEVQAS